MMNKMDGIAARLDDAVLLWKNGRRDGAFLNALIAVAALARKRYPNLRDRESFERCFADFDLRISRVEYRGECHPLEHIFYKWMRCNLVHEAEIPPDIHFNEDQPGSMSIRAGGAPEFILKLGTGWFQFIVESVRNACACEHTV
jgi:hypothetical protein